MSANSSPKNPTNYLIVGNAGVGKTTTIQELRRRGYNAHDLDEVPGACGWLNGETGEQRYVLSPEEEPLQHVEWHWSWVRPVIEAALRDAPSGINIWAGSARNQRELYGLFDGVMALFVESEILGERLVHRTTNDYGKDPQDYEATLGRNDRMLLEFIEDEVPLIDASRSVANTAQDVINFIPPDAYVAVDGTEEL